MAEKACEVCSGALPPRHSKFCSEVCAAEGVRRRQRALSRNPKLVDRSVPGSGKAWSRGQHRVPRQTCEVCGDPFYAPPIQIIRGGGKFCSNRCKGAFMAAHPETFPSTSGRMIRGGRRADLDNRYFRSSWEANYARYLNWLVKLGEIVRWEYEVDTFEFPIRRGSRFYVPDFKVWDTADRFEYHEVKGYMDKRSATKLKRMAKYFPDVRLVLIDREVYRGIADVCERTLPGWETAKDGRSVHGGSA